MNGVVVQNWSFKSGQTLTITGVPNHDATNFAINIGNSPDEIALHMNPRSTLMGITAPWCVTPFQGGSWCEEHRPDNFAFNQGEEFKIWIKFTREEFTITLPDQSEIRFPNRPGGEKYSFMNFDGEMRICSVEIK